MHESRDSTSLEMSKVDCQTYNQDEVWGSQRVQAKELDHRTWRSSSIRAAAVLQTAARGKVVRTDRP